MDSYLNLYKKIKHTETGQIGGNQRFIAKAAEGGHIKQLNSLRNEFIHFTPKGWSLEIEGLPRICLSVSRLISFQGWETQNVFWHSDKSKSEAMAAHKQFVDTMQRLEKHYAKHIG